MNTGMEPKSRGATRSRHHQYHHGRSPSADRLLGISQSPVTTSSTPSFELTEYELFDFPSESFSPTPVPSPKSSYQVLNHNNFGILAALPGGSGDFKTRPNHESETIAVFNHKASTSASLASSASSSPASSSSSRIMIPSIPKRPTPVDDKMRFYHHSAPVNVPILPAAMQRRRNGYFSVVDDVEEEEEEEERKEEVVPPHEMVAATHSPILACSVLEGAGRTLKGRDLRQVRNAVWRKTVLCPRHLLCLRPTMLKPVLLL